MPTIINIRHDYRLQQNRRTFTNYKKADWTQYTEDTESAFAQTTIPTNIHTANRIFTNIILMADKQNIPKGKMHSNCRLLPEDIVCKITQGEQTPVTQLSNTCDPALKLLNEEITSDIQKHKQIIWKEHLDVHWDHRHNTHTLWKTIHGLSNRAPPHSKRLEVLKLYSLQRRRERYGIIWCSTIMSAVDFERGLGGGVWKFG